MAARHEASDDDNYTQPRAFYQVKKMNEEKVFFIFIL
jgi:catalase